MHTLRRRSALIFLILLAAVALAAHAGGQEREASRGQVPAPIPAAKVVTEHVPVLLLPEAPRKAPVRVASRGELATRMGFRAVSRRTPPTAAPPAAPKPSPPPPVDRNRRIGRARLAAADYAGAVEWFRRSARAAPDDGDPPFELGIAQIAMGSDEAAARSIRKAIRLEPGLLTRSFDPARGFRDAAEFERVRKALEKRAAVVPGNADTKFCLAVVRLGRNDERCLATFRWLSRVTPEDEAAKRGLACAERRFTKKKAKSPEPSAARREGVEE